MNTLLTTLLGIAMVGIAPAAETKTISLDGISRAEQIIGKLGKPLGTVLRIKGKVRFVELSGKSPKIKREPGRYLIVSLVNGKALDTPIELEISPDSLPKAKDEEIIEAGAYERIMTYGYPRGIPRPDLPQAPGPEDFDFKLVCYIDVIAG